VTRCARAGARQCRKKIYVPDAFDTTGGRRKGSMQGVCTLASSARGPLNACTLCLHMLGSSSVLMLRMMHACSREGWLTARLLMHSHSQAHHTL
jgi:hypothetical protein